MIGDLEGIIIYELFIPHLDMFIRYVNQHEHINLDITTIPIIISSGQLTTTPIDINDVNSATIYYFSSVPFTNNSTLSIKK